MSEEAQQKKMLYALVPDNVTKCVRTSPDDEEHTNSCGGEKEEERKGAYRLWLRRGACLWASG